MNSSINRTKKLAGGEAITTGGLAFRVHHPNQKPQCTQCKT